MVDCIAGYHLNPQTCGIAKFNCRLAERLGVPVVPLDSLPYTRFGMPLLSLNVAELAPMAQRRLGQWLDSLPLYDVLLHGIASLPVETRLVRQASRRFGANRVIARAIGGQALWCPSTLEAPSSHTPEIRVLTFGMAHKLSLLHYAKLRELLQGQDYVIEVSTALHEDTPWQQAMESLAADLGDLFGSHVRSCGYLADGSLWDHIRRAGAVVSFFPQGVRENNTTVLAAMSAGTPVITNTDPASKPLFLHGTNIFDIDLLTAWPTMAQRETVVAGGRALASERSWDKLCQLLKGAA